MDQFPQFKEPRELQSLAGEVCIRQYPSGGPEFRNNPAKLSLKTDGALKLTRLTWAMSFEQSARKFIYIETVFN